MYKVKVSGNQIPSNFDYSYVDIGENWNLDPTKILRHQV